MTSYQNQRRSFQHFHRSFVQDDGSRFREVLSDEQIERAARLQNLSFGTGEGDIYSLPLTLIVADLIPAPSPALSSSHSTL